MSVSPLTRHARAELTLHTKSCHTPEIDWHCPKQTVTVALMIGAESLALLPFRPSNQ
jgi:hypothetical protein